jgi:hypothetical protein
LDHRIKPANVQKFFDFVGVPGGIRTPVIAVKAGGQTETVRNYRNTGALDGVLRAARNNLLCPRCVPGVLEIFDFRARFRIS